MPEFVMDSAGSVDAIRWQDLDSFTQGYLEAMFFTECSPAYDSDDWESEECQQAQEEGQADGTLPGDAAFGDMDPDFLKSTMEDCAAFQETNAADLAEIDDAQAGHDFWLTRNHHGAGFWDRGLGEIGKRLTESAHGFGGVNVYWENGVLGC